MTVVTSPVLAAEERMAAAMGKVNAATAELVEAIAEVAVAGLEVGYGYRSVEHWVALRCGVSSARAERLVAMARSLAELPACAARFRAGAITEDHAAQIARYVVAHNDAEAAELAPMMTVSQLVRSLRILPRRRDLAAADVDAEAEVAPSRGETPGRREVRFGYDDRGDWWARMVLPPDEGARVQKALEVARDELFAARRDGLTQVVDVGWSDAMLRVTDVALAGLTAADGGRRWGRGSERTLVVLHQRDDTATTGGLHLGPVLPDSLRRYLACDATVRWVLDREGNPHKVARTRRTVPGWLRTLVEDRDQGCRVPACGQRRWLHIHHIRHWEDGGPTVPENLVALCPFHHREHHLGRLQVSGDPTGPDRLVFTGADGRVLGAPKPPPPPGPDPPSTTGRFRPPLGERLDLRWLFWLN